MKIVALLPMKGNSERVPNKNLKSFCGKPLYHRVLNTLLACTSIDKVLINTDSDRIKADVSNTYGAERVVLVDRPVELQGDFVSMNKIIDYDITQEEADFYLQTHSTNPLLKTETVDAAIKKMLAHKEEADSIFSVTKLQTRLYDEHGNPVNHNPQKLIRTQDLPALYEENSNFFIFTRNSFRDAGSKRIGMNPMMYEIDKIEAMDIDEPAEFLIAEAAFKMLRL
ncbi:MAG: acylneuraminate cytidylyltransferase family protein [Flavobacteriaceae bacterium]